MSEVILLSLIVTFIVTVWLYVKYAFNYWRRRGVPFIEPSFPFGTVPKSLLQKLSMADELRLIYESSSDKIVGIYTFLRPALLVRDPSIIRDILIKDFGSFSNRGWHVNEEVDAMGDNMLTQGGEKWRNARTRFSPTFTTGKLKAMCDTIVGCGDSLQEYISTHANTGKTVEVREVFAKFATNVIASVTFGIEADCIKDPKSEFRTYGKRFFDPTIRNAFRNTSSFLAPSLSKFFRNRFVDKEVGDFMIDTVKQNLEYREKNNVTRKDFFQLLMQLRNTGKVQDDDADWSTKSTDNKKLLSFDEMAAQSYLFFIAGFESNSTTMSFCLYELARNPDVQQKAYEEIASVLEKHNGKLNYESIAEMKLMDRCIEETLRMHAPFGFFTRECTKDYQIKNSNAVIEKGTFIMFSVSGIHYDAKYYENPNKFMPERFDEDVVGKKTFMEQPFLAFGDGPRNCIGLRLGKLQSKISVILLLKDYKFELGNQHINKELRIDPRSMAKLPMDGINLKIISRK